MARYLDLDAWPRRQHFDFFRTYERPFWNLCAPVEVGRLHQLCSDRGLSFFLASLYLSLRAANGVEPFRQRLRGDRVLVHDVVHGGSTVLRDDETFGFGYFDFDTDFGRFQRRGRRELERVRAQRTLEPSAEADDLIHYTVLPWVALTSFSHARRWGSEDSIPKVVFGRHTADGERRTLPVSVEVHHALVDGLHVGRFFERFQTLLDDPADALEPG